MKNFKFKNDLDCRNSNSISALGGIWKTFSLLLFVLLASFMGNAQAPINDLCADALPIACGETLSGSVDTASDTGFPGSCAQDYSTGGEGVWYEIGGIDGQLILSTCNVGTDYDSYITLFSGECGSLTCLDGNDDSFYESNIWDGDPNDFYLIDENNGGEVPTCDLGSLLSIVSWEAQAGITYYAYVSGYSSSLGDFDFEITCNSICVPSLAIACPEDTDVACGESTDASFTGEPTTETAECTDEVVLTSEDTLTDNNDGCPFITRTWTATAGDLSDSCDQIITLTDSEDPEFTSVIEDFSV
ncbi:MAG: hypothetical protein ACI9EA_001897, partial [Pseudomonadales bacterium]